MPVNKKQTSQKNLGYKIKNRNKLLLALGLTLIFTISNAETFTIRHNSCSSSPLPYKVLRAKKPIKIVNYTYDSKGIDIESGIVNEFSEKSINLDNSKGKVQIIITKNIARDGKAYFLEYFFSQKVYCVTLDKKKCYSMPEEFFRSQKTNSGFGVQWMCPNKTGTQKSNTVAWIVPH